MKAARIRFRVQIGRDFAAVRDAPGGMTFPGRWRVRFLTQEVFAYRPLTLW
jgi:hypothetical protein